LNAEEAVVEKSSTWPFFIMMVVGSLLLGGSVATWLKSKGEILGEYGPLMTMCGIFIGAMMLAGALYSAARQSFKTN
jgi:hypothetical protein